MSAALPLSYLYAAAGAVLAGQTHPLGMAGVMLAEEVAAGRKPIQPGATEPFVFSADDWEFPQVVSLDGREVRITAVLARRPGTGAFRRLLAAIQAAGLKPVVVEPVGVTMPAILARWGWRRTVVGHGFRRVEEWRPRAT
jgi:hypothetical protein